MFREVATALAALVAIDYFYLDGKYIDAVQALVLSVWHSFIG